MILFKKTIFYISLFVSISCFSQHRETATFGEPTYLEREMMSYDKDTEAPAVVLFLRGKNYF
jgi:hypothetical protein